MRTGSRRSREWLVLSLGVAVACAAVGTRSQRTRDAERAVDELIAADRAFAAAVARDDAISKITSMLDDEVTMPTSHGAFARGRAEAGDALRAIVGSGRSRAEWSPIRGGISADARHGFTFGYMTVGGPDTATAALKYLSYWVRRPAGWRVAAYNLARRAPGAVSLSMMPPALPDRLTQPTADSGAIARHYASLIAAERAFSDRAQIVGLGRAFEETGSADAVNMGGRERASFVVGAPAIGRAIGEGAPQPGSPVSWGADRAIVASSGDLGVTFGIIRPNVPRSNASLHGFPFFTVWRRARPSDRWRYVAE
jgi:ketosteroid isomerase-like protein